MRTAISLLFCLALLGCSTGSNLPVSSATPGEGGSPTPVGQKTVAVSASASASASASQARVALPPMRPDDPSLIATMQASTDGEFVRHTSMAITPGRDRLWQNSPTPEQVAAYKSARAKAVKPVVVNGAGGDAPVFDSSGLVEVRTP